MTSLSELLELSGARHDHLCPRQVLGVRMGIAGLAALRIQAPVSKLSALIIVETDGCFVDGLEVATGATVGHRTLRVVDYGKVAATFVNVKTGQALRLGPKAGVRTLASAYAPDESERYAAQLAGYRVMPAGKLFTAKEVLLDPPLKTLLSTPDVRVICSACGEEIINDRQVDRWGAVLCRSCAGTGYYRPDPDSALTATDVLPGTTDQT